MLTINSAMGIDALSGTLVGEGFDSKSRFGEHVDSNIHYFIEH